MKTHLLRNAAQVKALTFALTAIHLAQLGLCLKSNSKEKKTAVNHPERLLLTPAVNISLTSIVQRP
jgi:hypothetical protein